MIQYKWALKKTCFMDNNQNKKHMGWNWDRWEIDVCFLVASWFVITQYQISGLYYSIEWVTKGSKCRRCVEETKMTNDIMTNMLLCLLNDHSQDMVFTYYSL
jgi:hypothetical protein